MFWPLRKTAEQIDKVIATAKMETSVSSPAFFRTSAPSLKLSIFPGFQRSPFRWDPFRLDGAVGESENRIGLFLWRLLLHPHVVSRNRIPGYPKWIKMMDGLSWFIIFLDCGHVQFFWVPHVFSETNSKMIGHIYIYPNYIPMFFHCRWS